MYIPNDEPQRIDHVEPRGSVRETEVTAIELPERETGNYGIIHKQAFIKYHGKVGRLVWDYIVLNELTFEDSETGKQYSFGLSLSDKKTENLFNELVEKYGI